MLTELLDLNKNQKSCSGWLTLTGGSAGYLKIVEDIYLKGRCDIYWLTKV